MKPTLRRNPRGGFTLLEVTITMAILAFGLLALAVMQLHAMRGGVQGRHAMSAAAIADAQMEQLQRRRWTSLTPTGGWTAPVTVNATVQRDSTDITEQPYSMSFRVADLVAGSTRSIDVRVAWQESSGRNRFVSLSSIRFNRDNL